LRTRGDKNDDREGVALPHRPQLIPSQIAYPDYERESGTKWPDKHLDPAEAQLFAFAALRALDGAGFDTVPKKDKADADRP
jgi:hypothetical protein